MITESWSKECSKCTLRVPPLPGNFSKFHLFQQFLLLQWLFEPGLNFESESDVCFSLTSFLMWGKKEVAARKTSRLLPRTSWPRNLAKKLLTLDIPWEIFQPSRWEPESRHIDRKSYFHVILKTPKQHIKRKEVTLIRGCCDRLSLKILVLSSRVKSWICWSQ